MITTVPHDQLLHDLAILSTRAYLDAYVKTELDPSIGLSFDGGDLAQEAIIAYGQAMDMLTISIPDED